MQVSPKQILRMAPNKVDYLIPGGEMINEFLGDGPGAQVCSQLWLASLVTSALAPGTTTGLSRVAGTDEFLKDCLEAAPAEWLGEAHAARWGASLGFLLKLLHSRDRLLIQTHPDGEKAKKYFGLPCGKDEAWYVLAARPEACIWLGFRPGVTPERFRALIEKQDTASLLDCLHRVPIRPGEVYFIPAGTVHAMGSGSLVAEIQEPVDITLRAEYIRPDGSRLPKESMYGAAGMNSIRDGKKSSLRFPVRPLRFFSIIHSASTLWLGDETSLASSRLRWRKVTMSASCSIVPDSRRCASFGRAPAPAVLSTSRLSWASTRTGTLRSFASFLMPPEISATSCWRLSTRPSACIN